VRQTRFQPIGRRPVDGGNADGAYAQLDFKEYIKQANEQRFLVLQIEDPEPLADLDRIAALPGLDMLFFGPGDFSHGIGAPGDWKNPKLLDARKRVADAALKNCKFAGTTGSIRDAADFISLGYRFLGIGADVLGLGKYFRELVGDFESLTSAEENKP